MGRDHRSAGGGVTRRAIAAIAVWVAVALPASAAAQSAKKQAREHFEQGEAFRKAGAYDKAIDEYEQAYALVPKAGFLFNIGLVHEEAGHKREAVDYYGRYLDADPNGAAAKEALARKTQLERELAAEQAAAEKAKEIAAHVAAGHEHLAAKRYDDALREYRVAYDESNNAEYLFDIAEAERLAGDKKQALADYQRYRNQSSAGLRLGDAVERIATLEREIEIEARKATEPEPKPPAHEPAPKPVEPIVTPTPVERPPEKPAPKQDGGISWWRVAVGAVLVGGGVAFDMIPDSSSNGELEAIDFLPVGLYGAGALFVYNGVF